MNVHSIGKIMTKNNDKKNDKRARIIEAAVKVFAHQGFYNSKVAMIAKEAGVADGTIYLYFKSKDDILISIFEEKIDFVINEQNKNLKKYNTAEEKLESFAKTHLQLIVNNPALAELLQVELRQSSKFMKDYQQDKFLEYLNIIGDVIYEGQQGGEFKESIKINIAKIIFFGALDEFATQWVLQKPRNVTITKAAKQICEIFLKGMIK
jgi:TetR/AcrR family fatty acid metabolism transcriptional regulator